VSDPALNRTVQVHTLEAGREVPCDGRIYRESDGKLSFGLRYTPDKIPFHRWLLARIAADRKWRGK